MVRVVVGCVGIVMGEELCNVSILTSEAIALLQDFLCKFHEIKLF